MRYARGLIVAFCLLAVGLAPAPGIAGESESWPRWRGPLASGAAPGSDPPTEWSESLNVAWKTEIPGAGAASPIVWKDRVFVLSAVPAGEPVAAPETPVSPSGRRMPVNQPTRAQQFTVFAVDRDSGRIEWSKVVREAVPHESTHSTATWASSSPVTDGEHLIAHFGSNGLYALDLDGHVVWEKDLGDMRTRRGFGEGSSPALHGDTVVVNWDHEGDSFIVALDKRTGEERWRREREEVTSWATPLIVERDDGVQVIVSATDRVRAYDLASGETVWEVGGMTLNTIPTPVYENGIVAVMSGFRGNALLAIRLDGAEGDLTGSDAILWSLDRDTPYTPSPLLYDGQLYFLKTNDAILSSFDFATGEKHYGPLRIDGLANVYASPVGAGGRVYVAGREGAVAVFEAGPEYRPLAVNELDDGFDASPAIAGDEIYLRGRSSLYRISAAR